MSKKYCCTDLRLELSDKASLELVEHWNADIGRSSQVQVSVI